MLYMVFILTVTGNYCLCAQRFPSWLGNCNIGSSFVGEENVDFVPDPANPEGGELVMRVLYPKGSYAGNRTNKGGVEFHIRDRPTFRPGVSLTLSYELYFSDNFDFVLGGKLPGFYGGTGKCAGGVHTSTCFSSRFMWRALGDGEIYGYIPNEKEKWFCNNTDVICHPKYGTSFGRGTFRFQKSTWQTIGQNITLNTPGERDGSMEIIYQGRSVYRIGGLSFRNDDTLQITSVYFSTFFGGSSSTAWASTDDVHTYFKNLVVVRHR